MNKATTKSKLSKVTATMMALIIMLTTLMSSISAAGVTISYPWGDNAAGLPYFNTKISSNNGNGLYIANGDWISPKSVSSEDDYYALCIAPGETIPTSAGTSGYTKTKDWDDLNTKLTSDQ